jgi:hypothetical protein
VSLNRSSSRSDRFSNSPGHPRNVNQDRRQHGHEAEQKCSGVFHRGFRGGSQILAGLGPARTALLTRQGWHRTQIQGRATTAQSWTIRVDDCLTRGQLPAAERANPAASASVPSPAPPTPHPSTIVPTEVSGRRTVRRSITRLVPHRANGSRRMSRPAASCLLQRSITSLERIPVGFTRGLRGGRSSCILIW